MYLNVHTTSQSPSKNHSFEKSSQADSPIPKQFQLIDMQEDEQTGSVFQTTNTNQVEANSGVEERKQKKRYKNNFAIELSPAQKGERVVVYQNFNHRINDESIISNYKEDEFLQPSDNNEGQINEEKQNQLNMNPIKEDIQQMPNNQDAKAQGVIINNDQQSSSSHQPQVFVPDTKGNFRSSAIINTDAVDIVQEQPHFSQNQMQLKQQLMSKVQPLHLLKMKVNRQNSWFNVFWPRFQLISSDNDNKMIMNAKRITARPISTFIMSLSKTDFEQNSANYMGKIKSNTIGSILNVFGPGLNPKNAKQKREQPRELLATIVYQTSIFAFKPREFTVYVKKDQFNYYSDFIGVTMYEDEVGLNQLFLNQANKQKMIVLNNKKPTWYSNIGRYLLNLRGLASKPSAKNFILQDNQKQVMLFGKAKDNEFVLQLGDAISPMIAFSIILSSFDTKFISESFST